MRERVRTEKALKGLEDCFFRPQLDSSFTC
jgi:hypothetical protein